MEPFEIVMQIIPKLTLEQKLEVAKLLDTSPCIALGHDYRKVGEVQENWRSPKYIVSICKRCGNEIRSH